MREGKYMKLVKRVQAVMFCVIFAFAVMVPLGADAKESAQTKESTQAIEAEQTDAAGKETAKTASDNGQKSAKTGDTKAADAGTDETGTEGQDENTLQQISLSVGRWSGDPGIQGRRKGDSYDQCHEQRECRGKECADRSGCREHRKMAF